MLFLQDSETHYVKQKNYHVEKNKQTEKPQRLGNIFPSLKSLAWISSKRVKTFFFFPDLLLSLSSIQETLQ